VRDCSCNLSDPATNVWPDKTEGLLAMNDDQPQTQTPVPDSAARSLTDFSWLFPLLAFIPFAIVVWTLDPAERWELLPLGLMAAALAPAGFFPPAHRGAPRVGVTGQQELSAERETQTRSVYH
jgi:hypothetical protein